MVLCVGEISLSFHHILQLNHLYLWTAGIIFCSGLNVVLGQCKSGFESSCIWSHEEPNAPFRWVSRRDEASSWVELTNCNSPNCGVAMIKSPWMPVKTSETEHKFEYKIYGYSEVYLRLFLMTDGPNRLEIFSKQGNYGDGFPTTWTSKVVTIPGTTSKYQLMLKAYTPYKEALLAVKGITLEDSSSAQSATPAPQQEKESSPRSRENEFERLEMSQALKDTLIRKQDLQLGFTAVVDPEICYN